MQPPSSTARSNFGSFASGDVEALIAAGDDEGYAPPPAPFERAPLADGDLASRPFGAAMRREFLIDFSEWTFLNAGAFGGVLACAAEDAERWRRHAERQPLRFFDRELFPHMVAALRDAAAFFGADRRSIAPLPNATAGLNAVISSVAARGLGPGDALFSLDVGYGAVKKMLARAAADAGAAHVEAHIPLPSSGCDEVVAAVEAALPANAKLAVFDAVTSNSALALPVARLVALCRAKGVPVLVDAAHGPGQLAPGPAMGLPAAAAAAAAAEGVGGGSDGSGGSDGGGGGGGGPCCCADYVVVNAHKWLGGPRGTAFLIATTPAARVALRPLVVTHGTGAGFLSGFIWDGARDYAGGLALGSALAWWRAVGPARARAYMQQLARDAAVLLVGAWGTRALAPPEMTAAMACVELPPGAVAAAQAARGVVDGVGVSLPPPLPPASEDANWLQDALHFRHAIEVPVKLLAGRLWVRISAAVYNELQDYERLARAVLAIAAAAAGKGMDGSS